MNEDADLAAEAFRSGASAYFAQTFRGFRAGDGHPRSHAGAVATVLNLTPQTVAFHNMQTGITSSEPVRVLIVDDNEAMLARIASVLKPGCKVVGSAKDGRTALAAARTMRPDVIVLDISMPGMTGLELACLLRKTGSTAAVVFLTVHDEEEFIAAAQAAGGIGYVVKPRLASDLLIAVREALAGRLFVSPIH